MHKLKMMNIYPNKAMIRQLKFGMIFGFLWVAAINAVAQKDLPAKPIAFSYHETMIIVPPDSLQVDTFYKKYSDAFGIPILSSGCVPDNALLMARDIVNYMLVKRPDIRMGLKSKGARVLVIAQSEGEMDLPERRNWKKPLIDDKRLTPLEREDYDVPGGIGSMTDRDYWNQRARGMGGTITSCAEENLLGYPGTRYYGENILVHEFSHNIMNTLKEIDEDLYHQIGMAYREAKDKGMYKNQYAINTKEEYWAEGTQWWFWSNFEFNDGDQRLQSPEDLRAYDPALYEILSQVYLDHRIPGDIYHGRNLRSKADKIKKW